MEYKTYSDIATKIKNDLDLIDESFITPAELMGYCNEAIDNAEAEILTLSEDYFLTKATINLVAGQDSYDLPSDIYANKIRGLIYSSNGLIYKLHRIRELDRFEEVAWIKQYASSDPRYQFLITNPAAGYPKLVLYPTPAASATAPITVWYIRNAKRITTGTDLVEIPEFGRYIEQFMKVRCYEKEGHPNLDYAVAQLEKYYQQMVSTLREMVPDYDNEIEQQLNPYQEMS
jgi:hypothetical protein